ncbi:hypothetical protein KZ483_13295 [Paenibacillus sp. sptzw28]|uniref:hypothetical protein n=1 Tax=Paenibacillus sp. sptzw28 TaxID=715179 RepID=UPI001C6E6627|nr:hypothetical protein [Paenibacillus sp. sptzw28]QYR23772.1 hypothetical protein KZ483_13295 [Paenibacillus sp. sptzw28]
MIFWLSLIQAVLALILASAMLHWSIDDWKTVNDTETTDSGLGTWYVDLPPFIADDQTIFVFTFYWQDAKKWEGTDFIIHIRPE